jgi:hypothetical protein
MYLSQREAVEVIVGAVLPGHFTAAGQVTVREPVPSCFRSRMKERPAVAVGKVKVQLPVRVRICTVPFARSIV